MNNTLKLTIHCFNRCGIFLHNNTKKLSIQSNPLLKMNCYVLIQTSIKDFVNNFPTHKTSPTTNLSPECTHNYLNKQFQERKYCYFLDNATPNPMIPPTAIAAAPPTIAIPTNPSV